MYPERQIQQTKAFILTVAITTLAYRYMLHFKAPRTIADGDTCPFLIVSDNGNK